MSYYDDSSLFLSPNGYKTSVLFAQKPMDANGQLAFTRSNDTATRVNSAGLIEKVRTNRVLQSQTLSVSPTWTAYSGTTVTADAIAAPDGTLTADRIAGTSGAFRGIRQTISSSAVPHTFSVYLKSATGSATTARIWVDSGVSLVNVTTDWQRFSVTATTAASFDVQISTAVSLAIDVYAWGAQLETGDIATDYIPTTTAAVSVGPVANVPRLDYLGSTCPRLLLEPQRTNLVTNSENISGSNWTNIDSTDSINVTATLDPSGYYGADKLQETTANSVHVIAFQTSLMSSANTYTFSSFLKAAERNWVAVYIYNGTSSFSAYFNLATGVKGSVTSSATSAIESYGNGWYRCSVTLAVAGSASANGGVITATADGTISYAGTAGSGIYVWGAQLEVGSYPTSYIPTLAASVTRGAENCSKSSITSLIGQTEGTLFAEIVRTQSITGDAFLLTISDNSANNWIFLGTENTGGRFYLRASNSVIIDNLPALSVGTHKLALAYKSGSITGYIDGVQIFTSSSSFTIGSLTGTSIGSSSPTLTANVSTAGAVKQALLFKTRLSNSELAQLTTI